MNKTRGVRSWEGPLQLRTLCNAMMGPKKCLEMLSGSLESVDEIDVFNICKSMEEIIFTVEAYNRSKKSSAESGKFL